MVTEEKTTERIEEYLEALWRLEDSGQELSVTNLSRFLKVTPPSVSEMLQRLIKEGYVSASGRGVYSLTANGKALGEKVIRRHRLLERFLVDILEMEWDKAHEEACRLEHNMSAEMEDSLDRRLNHPSTCPHGQPIPGEQGEQLPVLTLADLEKGEEAVIMAINEEEPGFLRYMASLGLFPGVKVRLKEVAPFGGTRIIAMGNCRYSLGDEVVGKIIVQRV